MSRPRWLEPLPDAALMREHDRWAIETKGIPSLELMERAGEGLARVVAERVPAGRIAVVCGKGNNGGDGLVAARLLRQAGREVEVLLVWPAEWLSDDAKAAARQAARRRRRALRRGAAGQGARPGRRAARDGLDRRAEGPARGRDRGDRTARAARWSPPTCPAAWTPAPGEVAGAAIEAVATAAFHAAKPGLWIRPGQGARRRRARDRHRDPARRAGRGRLRPGHGRGPARRPAPRRRVDEVHRRARSWSSAARAGSPARPAWPRSRRCGPARAT